MRTAIETNLGHLVTAERTKAMFLVPSLGGGGAERVFAMLLTHLDRARFELHLGILQDTGEYMEEVPADVMIHHLNISRVRYALAGLIKLIWRVKPRVIVSTLGHLNLALILIRPFMPPGTRLVVREVAIATSYLKVDTGQPILWRWLYRRFYKRADKIVCLSDSMVDDMAEHFRIPRAKMVRIYNPVDMEKVRKLAERGGTPYSGPGPHVVAVGRLTKQKGFDILLDAWPVVMEKFPAATLTILGQGPLQEALTAQSQKLGLSEKVTFAGFQANPWRYLKHADLFVLPSRYEGTSNVLLEVLALGTPVLTTDCPGGNREIRAYNPQIVLVPPEDERALAEAIVALCKMPKKIEDPAVVRQHLRAFSLPEIVGQYSRLLEQI